MASPNAYPSGAARRYLPAVLLGILFLAVGVAWWLVRSRRIPIERGEQIIADIHGKGLKEYWPAYSWQWFLSSVGGRTIGWSAVGLARRANGGCEGVRIVVHELKGRTESAWEWWRLNADATKGSYEAGEIKFGQGLTLTTLIELKDGKIEAIQGSEELPVKSSAPAPANYIPEGTMELAARLVGQRKTRAQFHMVLNSVPPAGKRTSLAMVQMASAGRGEEEFPGSASRVNYRIPALEQMVEGAYFFDEAGRLVGYTMGELKAIAASKERVYARYRLAGAMVMNLVRAKRFPPAPPSQNGKSDGIFNAPTAPLETIPEKEDDGATQTRTDLEAISAPAEGSASASARPA